MHNEEEKEFDKEVDSAKYVGGGSDQSFDILKQISQEIKDDPIPMLDNCLKQNSGMGTRGRPPMDLQIVDQQPRPKTRQSAKVSDLNPEESHRSHLQKQSNNNEKLGGQSSTH